MKAADSCKTTLAQGRPATTKFSLKMPRQRKVEGYQSIEVVKYKPGLRPNSSSKPSTSADWVLIPVPASDSGLTLFELKQP